MKCLLKITGISKSLYFYHKKVDKNNVKHQKLCEIIKKSFNDNKGRYGYRRLKIYIEKVYNLVINHKVILKILRELDLHTYQCKYTYSSYDKTVESKVCSNKLLDKVIENDKEHLKQNFKTAAPNQKWTTDVSLFKCTFGHVYFSPILDMYNGEIISYNLSFSPNMVQTVDMLSKARAKHPNWEGLIFHSDQGYQYFNCLFREFLDRNGAIQSMSRKGNCYDNAMMENFFGIMKKEMFYGQEDRYETMEQFTKAVEEYIYWYNNIRFKSRLGYLSPVEYRLKNYPVVM